MGVQRANPSEYVARYGTQLEDSQTLITQARRAGVVEDIVCFISDCFFFHEKFALIFSILLVATRWCCGWIIEFSIIKLRKLSIR